MQGYVENPEVFGIATSGELLQFLESKGVNPADGSLQISGVNVIEYALRKGIKGMALLCETAFPEALDIKACQAGIKKLSELPGIDIDLGRIENEAARFDE